jgi:hypothetical protein
MSGSCTKVDTNALKHDIYKKINKIPTVDEQILTSQKECVAQIMCEQSSLYNKELLDQLGVTSNCPTKKDESEDEIPASAYNLYTPILSSSMATPATSNPDVVKRNNNNPHNNPQKHLSVNDLADKLALLTTTQQKDESLIKKYVEMFNGRSVQDRRSVIRRLLNKIQSYHTNDAKNNSKKIKKIKDLISSLTKSDIFHPTNDSEISEVESLINLKNDVFKLVGGRSIKRKQTKSRRQKKKTTRTYRKQHK